MRITEAASGDRLTAMTIRPSPWDWATGGFGSGAVPICGWLRHVQRSLHVWGQSCKRMSPCVSLDG